MDSFPKIGGGNPPQIIPFVHRVFHYFHHPFWGKIPYFWKHPCEHMHSKKKNFSLATHFWGVTTPQPAEKLFQGSASSWLALQLQPISSHPNLLLPFREIWWKGMRFNSKRVALQKQRLSRTPTEREKENHQLKSDFCWDMLPSQGGKWMDVLDVFWISLSPVTPMDFQYLWEDLRMSRWAKFTHMFFWGYFHFRCEVTSSRT